MPVNILNASSFNNLALFICQLFINGQFRTSHILYDSNVSSVQIMIDIESVCPQPIPWLITNIQQRSSSPWYHHKDTNSVLQLIFYDPNILRDEIEIFERYFTYYRIFVFSTTRQHKEKFKIIRELSPSYDSNTLILYYNIKWGEIFVNWIPINDYDVGEERPVRMNPDSKIVATDTHLDDAIYHENLYEKTFGEYDRRRSIAVNVHRKPGRKSFFIQSDIADLVTYYATHLPTSYVNYSDTPMEYSLNITNRIAILKNGTRSKATLDDFVLATTEES